MSRNDPGPEDLWCPVTPNMYKFAKLASNSFQYGDWLTRMMEAHGITAIAECCPWHDQHTEKGGTGFKAWNATGLDSWNACCNHTCGKDRKRGASDWMSINEKPDETKQDRLKYLDGQCQMWGIKDASELLEWCDEETRTAWHAAQDGEEAKPAGTVYRTEGVRLDGVEMLPVDWLSPGWIVANAVNLLSGRTGIGKSQFAIRLAACLTRGQSFRPGDPAPEAADVLILASEDNLQRAIAPRYASADADMSRVHYIKGYAEHAPDGKVIPHRFRLANAVGALSNYLERFPEIKLVIIDPMNAFIGGKTDAHRNAEMRAVLEPLNDLAERFNVTFLVVHHDRKGQATKNALTDQVGGSNATVELARCVIAAARDSDNEGHFVAQVIKLSYGKPPPGIVYTIEATDVTTAAGNKIVSQRVVILEGVKAKDIGEVVTDDGEEKRARNDAQLFLAGELADGEEHPSDAIWAAAKAEGLGRAAVLNAADKMGVKKDKRGFKPSRWVWWLPGGAEAASDAAREASVQKAADILSGATAH